MKRKLVPVFKQLKKRDLFFIDSRTTNDSKTTAAAQKVHLTVASRKIFLDNERDYSKIYQILMDVAEAPAGNSTAYRDRSSLSRDDSGAQRCQ